MSARHTGSLCNRRQGRVYGEKFRKIGGFGRRGYGNSSDYLCFSIEISKFYQLKGGEWRES